MQHFLKEKLGRHNKSTRTRLSEENEASSHEEPISPSNVAPDPVFSEGLHVLRDFQVEREFPRTKVDVVAIHGLNGDPWRTWTENKVVWFSDLLPAQLPEFDFRISTFGYNSKLLFSSTVFKTRDFATQLLNSLHYKRRETATEDVPIVFICHSLGGIVFKKMVTIAHEREELYSNIKNSTKLVVFFGTPHGGSDAARVTRILRNIVNYCTLGSTRIDLLKNLEKDSAELTEIAEQFVQRATELKIISVYEGRPLFSSSSAIPIVVDKASALLNLSHEQVIAIDADHRSMCRFESADDPRYKPVLSAVATLIKDTIELEESNEIGACLDTLHFKQFEARGKQILDPHSETFAWIFQHDKYRGWEGDYSSSLLLVRGKPGSGKSTLAGYVRARQRLGIVVDFFYSARGGSIQNGHYWMLRSILYQLLSRIPGLWPAYRQHYEACHRTDSIGVDNERLELQTHSWTYGRLCSIFSSLSSVRGHDLDITVYIIIDALDESEVKGRQEMIQMLHQVCTQNSPGPITFKIFLTSQPEAKVEHILRSCHSLVLEEETESDIYAYVTSEIKRVAENVLQCDSNELQFLSSYLIKSANGVFLWVKLVLIELDNRAMEGFCSIAELEALMLSIPKDLKQLYERILHKICSKAPEAETNALIQECQTVLRWITYSPKPLHMSEMLEILAASSCDRQKISITELERWRVRNIDNLRRRLITLCGNLVEVKGPVIQFIHATVREYLLEQPVDVLSVDPDESLLEIASLCQVYVACFQESLRGLDQFQNRGISPEERLQATVNQISQFQLVRYIFEFGKEQLTILHEDMKRNVSSAMCTLKDTIAAAETALQPAVLESILEANTKTLDALLLNSDVVSTYFKFPCLDQRINPDLERPKSPQDCEYNTTLLHVAVLLKSKRRVEIIIHLALYGADTEQVDSFGQTPLQLAIQATANPHAHLLKLLEERSQKVPAILHLKEALTSKNTQEPQMALNSLLSIALSTGDEVLQRAIRVVLDNRTVVRKLLECKKFMAIDQPSDQSSISTHIPLELAIHLSTQSGDHGIVAILGGFPEESSRSHN